MDASFLEGLDPEQRKQAEAVIDLEADENACPACGTGFAGAPSHCPECGLRIGA